MFWLCVLALLSANVVDSRVLRQPQVVQKQAPEQTKTRPNIVWILADDLHYEEGMFEKMPNVRRMKTRGLTFPNHVSQSPLCGPSRASLLVGRLPHNNGYRVNDGEESLEAFSKIHNKSVSKWLIDAGYYTAFLGKYVNAMVNHPIHKERKRGEHTMPSGWSHFGGFTGEYDFFKNRWIGGAYSYYNSSQWDIFYDEHGTHILDMDNSDYPIKIHDGVHQADFLGAQTIGHVGKAIGLGKPFFIFTSPVMVHHGNCAGHLKGESQYAFDDPWLEQNVLGKPISPCVKKGRTHEELQSTLGSFTLHARNKAWNDTGIGAWKHNRDCCSGDVITRLEYGAANRTGSMLDLDDMVGVIIEGLQQKHVLSNTFVIFTSDNGYHLGEHKFSYGKELAYDHDVRVPLVIHVPNGFRTGVSYLPTTHLDITRTIVDIALAGSNVAPSLAALDGKSFVNALQRDVPVTEWRRFSYSEMFSFYNKTWRNMRYMNETGQAEWTMSQWCTGEIELYHVRNDKYQLVNTLDPKAGAQLNAWGEDIMSKYFPVLNGLGHCVGNDCNNEISVDLGNKRPSELLDCMAKPKGQLGHDDG